MAFTAVAFLLAAIGIVRRWRAGYGDLSAILLAFSPIVIVGAQSYGGEALLRVVFFALPFVSILGALAFFPRPGLPRLTTSIAMLVVCVSLVPPFFVARYGNEAWDMKTPQDQAAIQWLYNSAPAGSTFVSMVTEIAWGYRDLLKFKLVPPTAGPILSDPTKTEHLLDTPGPGAFLIVSQDQTAFGRLSGGLPSDWARHVVNTLLATHHFRVVYSNSQAEIIGRVSSPLQLKLRP